MEGRKSLVLQPPGSIHQYIDDVVGVTNQGGVEASYSTVATLETSWGQDLFAPFSPPKQREGRHLVKTALLPPRPPVYYKQEITYRSLGVFSAMKRSSEGNDLAYQRGSGGDEDYDEFL